MRGCPHLASVAVELPSSRSGAARRSCRQLEFLTLQDLGVVDVEKVRVEGGLDDAGKDGDQVDLVFGEVPAGVRRRADRMGEGANESQRRDLGRGGRP